MNFDPLHFLMSYPVLVFSLTLHEYAHAITAEWSGDDLPREQGRITLNPLPHMDPIGTVLFPLIGHILGLPVFGWAKPVQIQPHRLRHGAASDVIVTLAGPMANLFIALFATIALQAVNIVTPHAVADGNAAGLAIGLTLPAFLLSAIFLNMVLFFFNLLPVAPLDGSHLMRNALARFAPSSWLEGYLWINQYAPFIFLLMLVTPVVSYYLALTAGPVAALLYGYASLPYLFP